MKTITIQIGNSDDKLTQTDWKEFVLAMKDLISQSGCAVHFFGGPPNWEPRQNVAWVMAGEPMKLKRLKAAITEIRKDFDQDSAAWTVGNTEFI